MTEEQPKRKLRILFSSNAPWSTSGYGTQMADLLPLIRDEGYEVGIVCYFGLHGGKIVVDGIMCYPDFSQTWGATEVLFWQKDYDVVIPFQDIWPVDMNALREYKNLTPLVPIDHDPIQPNILERLKLAYRIITYSQFGQEIAQRNGLHSTYIQHTVNTDVLKPYSEKEKLEFRKKLNVPEDFFMFGMVAANKENPPRKAFQQAMDAFAKFHKKHPRSGFYAHTLTQLPGGFPLEEYAKFLGIQDVFYKIPPFDLMMNVDRVDMAMIYNTLDCLLMPSVSEGFGVPAIEAQSCGVPAIVNDFTSMPELVTPETGRVCKIAHKRFDPMLSYVAEPDTESLYQCMEEIFAADRKKMAKACRKHAVENYALKTVFKEKWVPFLQKLESELVR